MSKRAFRKQPGSTPQYPTLEQFDGNRRTFLGHLGAALLGALVLGDLPDLQGSKKKKPPGKKRPGDTGGKKKKGKKPPKRKPKKKPPPDDLDGMVMGLPARIDEVEQ